MSAPGPDRRLRNLLILVLLVALSAGCVALLKFRIQTSGSERYSFMTWNLFLAWIPVLAALLAHEMSRSAGALTRTASLPMAALWLVFLPNAPYMATDLIHLTERPQMPFWYDSAMMLGFAGTGVVLGLASLLFMQESVQRHLGRALGWLFAIAAITLSAFGVYLGRFERLNSWEVVSQPSVVLREVWLHLHDPLERAHAAELTLVMALLMLAAYLVLFSVTERGSRLLSQRLRR